MEKQDWVNDNQERRWNNSLMIGYYALLSLIFPTGFILAFVRHPANYLLLIIGIVLFYVIYEWILSSYIRVSYLNGNLEFKRPFLKCSLLFRKKNRKICIRPDEWTEVYRYWYKGGTAYYFRNNGKITGDFPREARRRMREEDAWRVI